ncbi:MarR family transcriptional regulator [Streptomyces sp. NPDC051921]|uniref:MarR family winged helix-turn-helix transcriptional regulator n=1 Tax=Streptomyces sp. NPDC051921 TaxID=3155806 RepID=UPI00343566FC
MGERTGLTTGPATRLVDRLEKAGYVHRAADPHDRRKVIVEPVGRPDELDRVLAPAGRRIAELLGGYPPEQLAVLFDYFGRAAEVCRQAAEDL